MAQPRLSLCVVLQVALARVSNLNLLVLLPGPDRDALWPADVAKTRCHSRLLQARHWAATRLGRSSLGNYLQHHEALSSTQRLSLRPFGLPEMPTPLSCKAHEGDDNPPIVLYLMPLTGDAPRSLVPAESKP